ncbi:piezo-type mechanosensitive ion channel component 1-like isoform X2 [Paralichthys olivaceus]|uniref:piezo-type mechanosensitive ion channel component 1-like isoform X2 n=1 Tax=Paralichthys olivaceus TaxID=8255 RepID=UPI003753E387
MRAAGVDANCLLRGQRTAACVCVSPHMHTVSPPVSVSPQTQNNTLFVVKTIRTVGSPLYFNALKPLFTMSVQQQSIQPFTEAEYENLTQKFGDNAVAMQFITLYSYEDIVTAMIEGSSGSVWRISPPSRQEVIKEEERLAWTFQRDLGKGGTVEHTFDKYSIDLEPGNPVRADLASLLVGNRTKPVLVPYMFPNYIRAPNGAEAKPVSQLYKDNSGTGTTGQQRLPSPLLALIKITQ